MTPRRTSTITPSTTTGGSITFYVDGEPLKRHEGSLPEGRIRLYANSWYPTWFGGSELGSDCYAYADWIEYQGRSFGFLLSDRSVEWLKGTAMREGRMSETTTERAGFTGELWRSIDGIYTGILAHPFLRGLTDGSLPEDSFKHYVLQSTLSVLKKSALSGKAPTISALPSGRIATESLSIL